MEMGTQGTARALELALDHAPLSSVLDVLVRTVESNAPLSTGSILLLDQHGHLRNASAPSMSIEVVQAMDGVAPDALAEVARAQGLAGCWSTPIVSRRGELLGALAVYTGDQPPNELVELVTRTAALVIERDREATERRAAELELSRQVAALTRIHSLALRLAQIADLQPKLVEILAAAAELHDTQCGLLSVQNLATGALEVAASMNFPSDALDIVREITPSPAATGVGTLLHTERVIVDDTETDPRFVGYRRIARNVGFRAVHSTPIYTRQGALLGVLSLHRPRPGRPTTLQMQLSDMCALHAADAIEGARAHERLSDLADNMSQHAWIADERGSITWFNQRWFDYTGTRADDVLGWGWTRVHHPEHVKRVVSKWQRAWDTGAAWEDTFPIRGRDGAYRWFLARAQPIRDGEGRVVRWFGTHTDITEQRETQIALEAANRTKDHFLAALSHELRTPLSPILMASAAIERSPDLPPSLRPKLAMIRRNVELEVKLIDDLLDLSRVASGKLSLAFEPIIVAEAIDDVIEICRQQLDQKQLQVSFSHDGEGVVKADPSRFHQILWNLLKNAAKFTPENGAITIRAEVVGFGETARSRVIIHDTGIGIPADAIHRVFDAFEQADTSITRQFGGLGLGLAISRKLAELHGGTITAASAGLDKGATFTLELPRHRGKRAITARPITAEHTIGKRLLVVDDHADTAEILETLLVGHGFIVRVASTAKEALALAMSEQFDLIVSDVGLPDLSGYELMKQIKEKVGIPGIAMSGWGRDEDRERGLAAGFADHLVKPIGLNSLAATIHRVLLSGAK